MKTHAIVFSAVVWYFSAHNFFVVCGHTSLKVTASIHDGVNGIVH